MEMVVENVKWWQAGLYQGGESEALGQSRIGMAQVMNRDDSSHIVSREEGSVFCSQLGSHLVIVS